MLCQFFLWLSFCSSISQEVLMLGETSIFIVPCKTLFWHLWWVGGFQKVCMTSNFGKILKSYLNHNISPTLLSNSNWELWYSTAQCFSQAICSSAVKYFEIALISFKGKIPLQRLISIIKLSTIINMQRILQNVPK